MNRIDFTHITVHCSATRPSHNTTVGDVREMHLARGWRNIGYHWFIERDGSIKAGRPETETGAHVYGYNKRNLGICLSGGLNDETGEAENNFTEEQFDSLQWLLDEKRSQFGVPLTNVKGHRDYSPDLNRDGRITPNEFIKMCPCFDVQEWLAERDHDQH